MSQISELWQRIDDAKALLDRLRPLPREQEERAMQKFRLWWTYHSNAIEGNSLTQGETEVFLMEGLTAKGKPLNDHLDLRGHSNAINYLLGFVRNEEVLTEAAIRKLHEILLIEPYQVQAITPEGQPTMKTVELGRYKSQPNHVRTPTGETHFYAAPEETPAKMHELMTWYRSEMERGTMHLVELAARYHHRFTAIHPFDDGNGRMSRLLMNLLLMQAGYPPVVIRLAERDRYLAALRRADAGEAEDFLKFHGEHVIESLELFARAARGEDIQEPTDLEKEIVLLRMSLSDRKEPEPPTAEMQRRVFVTSLDPLIAEIARLLDPLRELFRSANLGLEAAYRNVEGPDGYTFMSDFDFLASPRMPRDPAWWNKGALIGTFDLRFELNAFRRGGESFDLVERLELKLDVTTYALSQLERPKASVIRHGYSESLTRDETREIAQRVTRSFLDGIKAKTNGQA